MEWQPIDTLPKDYEPFDVWSERLDRIPDCCLGGETYGKKHGIVYQADYDCNGPVMELIEDATHWMRVSSPNKKGSAD